MGLPEHLLGDLPGYWTNEYRAYLMPKPAQCKQDTARSMDARDAIAELTFIGQVPRRGKKGQELAAYDAIHLPHNTSATFPTMKRVSLYTLSDGNRVAADVERLDPDALEPDLSGESATALPLLPAEVSCGAHLGQDRGQAGWQLSTSRRDCSSRTMILIRDWSLLVRALPRFQMPEDPVGGSSPTTPTKWSSGQPNSDRSYFCSARTTRYRKTFRQRSWCMPWYSAAQCWDHSNPITDRSRTSRER